MSNISSIENVINTFWGFVEGTISNMFGEWNNYLETLIIFMIIDYLTGFICAAVFKKSQKSDTGALRSKVGWKGLIKKCYTLLFVLIAYRLDLAIGVEYIKTTVIVGFIINEGLSIVENAGLMGMPLPSTIKNAIEILQTKVEKGGTKENIKEKE